MKKNKLYKLIEEDRIDLYRKYFEAMMNLGYSAWYIGQELARITMALDNAVEGVD